MKRETPTHEVARERGDEDGPHSSGDLPRDRAQDAHTPKDRRPSNDVDPDSAESMVDRDDTSAEP